MTLPVAAETVADLAEAGAESGVSAGAARASSRSHSLTERTGVKPAAPRRPTTGRSSRPVSPSIGDTDRRRPSRRLPMPTMPSFSGTGSGGGAHRLVIAEFVACLVLIGLTPIFSRPPGNGHLYVANDFLRLSATCLLFFVLALLSNQPKSARFAAAFGALVTLGALFNSSQGVTALANLFANKGGGS